MAERKNGQNGEAWEGECIEFRGEQFTSRASVRWAAVYAELGVRYQYRQHRFELDMGLAYTPEFYLPEHGYYIDTNADSAGTLEIERAKRLSSLTNRNVYLFWDLLPDTIHQGGGLLSRQDRIHSAYYWCECDLCRRVSIEHLGDSRHIRCGCTKKLEGGWPIEQRRIKEAYQAAFRVQFTSLGNGKLHAVMKNPSDQDMGTGILDK